ncbi:TetR/AcrR family transcriptional regulator [Microbacterium sp. SORGH_AS_0888]|uniref:TetR/AcrR family transcriptional regulator n=1 Tax=Microbacterium sp. SORGH_AS_0888 TaxID=3041791 RepID=UPI00278687B6|nr:TetR/AcrR family transcriptional regulator [Microbacterium sp. SORGH_AS_0888]MDQ1130996.1 AcrR family transcriptional regulator [Microbacterium sp. SORGH_AS_0888]
MSGEATPTEILRRALETSSDPRVGRTRTAIAEAVHELSRRGEDVTVAALARTAGISRASFYSHYASLDELALALQREAFATISDLYAQESGDPPTAMRVAQQRLVAHFAESRGLSAAIAGLPVSKEMHLGGIRALAAVIERSLAEHPDIPVGLEIAPTARYIAGAAYGLIDAWLTGELEMTDDALVDHLTRLLPPWLSGLE